MRRPAAYRCTARYSRHPIAALVPTLTNPWILGLTKAYQDDTEDEQVLGVPGGRRIPGKVFMPIQCAAPWVSEQRWRKQVL
jgi:hypothetical protein